MVWLKTFSKIQIGHALGYLNNREDVLKDSGENVPFFGNGNDQKYCDEKAPLMIDFANHGGLRPGIIAFDEMKLMNTTVNQMGALSDQFKQHEQKFTFSKFTFAKVNGL